MVCKIKICLELLSAKRLETALRRLVVVIAAAARSVDDPLKTTSMFQVYGLVALVAVLWLAGPTGPCASLRSRRSRPTRLVRTRLLLRCGSNATETHLQGGESRGCYRLHDFLYPKQFLFNRNNSSRGFLLLLCCSSHRPIQYWSMVALFHSCRIVKSQVRVRVFCRLPSHDL